MKQAFETLPLDLSVAGRTTIPVPKGDLTFWRCFKNGALQVDGTHTGTVTASGIIWVSYDRGRSFVSLVPGESLRSIDGNEHLVLKWEAQDTLFAVLMIADPERFETISRPGVLYA